MFANIFWKILYDCFEYRPFHKTVVVYCKEKLFSISLKVHSIADIFANKINFPSFRFSGGLRKFVGISA